MEEKGREKAREVDDGIHRSVLLKTFIILLMVCIIAVQPIASGLIVLERLCECSSLSFSHFVAGASFATCSL